VALMVKWWFGSL